MHGFPTEKIKLSKQNGSTHDNIEALVDQNTIFISDTTIIIEEGDFLIRTLPNGAIENYEVIDRGFCKGIGTDIPDGYQVKVKKIISQPAPTKNLENNAKNIYNIYHSSGKININSTDNSVKTEFNIQNEDTLIFEELKKIAHQFENKDTIITTIEDMKHSLKTTSYADKYKNFISEIADHITVFAPFIPALTSFLSNQ